MFVNATAYYLRCTMRNRVMATARRMRRPKYVVGLALVVLYFWGFLFRSLGAGGASDPVGHRQNALWMLSGMCLMQVTLSWFASGRGAAFRQADVQILFPRPFTRFQLLMFKWAGNQFGSILSSFIIGLFVVRHDGFSYPFVVAGFWLIQTVLATHGSLFGLILSHIKTRGGLGARLRVLPAYVLLTVIPICVGVAWQGIGGVHSLADARSLAFTAPLSTLLAPFEYLAAPVIAQDLAAFATAALIPLGVFLVHLLVLWLLLSRTKLHFEDQALEVAAKLHNVRRDGIGALRSKKELVASKPGSPWPLAATGPVWKALVWKNVVSISRFPRRSIIRVAIIVIVLAVVIGRMASSADSGDAATRFGFVILGLLFYLTILGPALIRVDLRIDIPHFDVLKSMPIRGRALIFGEIMGSVVVLWAIQIAGCVIAAILISQESGYIIGWDQKGPGLIATLAGFLAFDFALLTSENLLALWLPSFVRLGRGVKPGFDQMGQNLLGALVRILVLIVLLIPAALFGTGIGFLGIWLEFNVAVSIAVGVVCGSAILILEGYAMILLSEGRYNRFDISGEQVANDA